MSDSVRWVLKALAVWPRTTIVVGTLSIVTAFAISLIMQATTAQFAILLIAQLAGLAWMKVMGILMLYPLIYHAPFPGSFLKVSFVTQTLAVTSIALQMVYPPPEMPKDVPAEALAVALIFLYPCASLFFGSFLRLSYQFQRGRRMPWRRLDEGGAIDPLGLSG